MITAFRSILSTWVVRGFFLLLVAAFGMWGVGDVLRMRRTDTTVATVGGTTIDVAQAEDAFKREMAEVMRSLGGKIEPTPEIRRAVAAQAVDRLVGQALLAEEAKRLRIAVPDGELVRAVHEIPAFRGQGGGFDRARFDQFLRGSGLTEQRFLDLMRADLKQRQLMDAIRAGVSAPDVLARAMFEAQGEKRTADLVELPFSAAKPPAEPDDETLRRWYENHPDAYRIPEYRRIKAVVLSPQTLAKDIQIPEDELRAAYDARRAEFVVPAKRSAEVIATPDEAKAQALAAEWRGGADWAKMEADAQAQGATAVALTDATEAEFPSPELAHVVFGAPEGTIDDPVRGPLGWTVLRVTKVTPGSEKTFDDAKGALRDRLLAEKATDLMYDRANKVDNALGGGGGLETLPGDLGLAAVTGTLDAQGNTPAGQPAPIPGPPELRAAIASAAFSAGKGDPPRLTEVPTPSAGGSAYYALEVEDVTPSAAKPFAEVKDQVEAEWTKDAVRKEQETAASAILAAVKGGETLEAAAAKDGLKVRRTAATTRSAPAEGVPRPLVGPLFAAKKGEPAMAEGPDGFVVAVPVEIERPAPGSDPVGYERMRDALTRSLANDVEVAFVQSLRDRTPPRVNQATLQQIAQP